jgi:hypothetical protein
MAGNDATQPEPGTDSRVEDWVEQSVERDAALADRLTDNMDDAEAEAVFDQQASARAEHAARQGENIDPDQGRFAYRGSDS